jgi:hypothetical protein
MKFTIRIDDIESLLKAIVSRLRKTDKLRLSACAARVFVECKHGVGGVEALVFSDGAVRLPAPKFRDLVKTYKERISLTFDGSADGLRIENFVMPVLGYDPSPKPPQPSSLFSPFGTDDEERPEQNTVKIEP